MIEVRQQVDGRKQIRVWDTQVSTPIFNHISDFMSAVNNQIFEDQIMDQLRFLLPPFDQPRFLLPPFDH